jgi:hypothetical protein
MSCQSHPPLFDHPGNVCLKRPNYEAPRFVIALRLFVIRLSRVQNFASGISSPSTIPDIYTIKFTSVLSEMY